MISRADSAEVPAIAHRAVSRGRVLFLAAACVVVNILLALAYAGLEGNS